VNVRKAEQRLKHQRAHHEAVRQLEQIFRGCRSAPNASAPQACEMAVRCGTCVMGMEHGERHADRGPDDQAPPRSIHK